MLIYELFNQIAPYKKINTNEYEFEINGEQFVADFNYHKDQHTWEFIFFHIEDNKPTVDVTGAMGRDAIKVFGTIRAIVADWIAHSGHAKEGIFFAAKSSDGARAKLYSRFLKELERKGWSTMNEPGMNEFKGYQVYYANPNPDFYSD